MSQTTLPTEWWHQQSAAPAAVPPRALADDYPCVGLSPKRIVKWTIFALGMLFLNRFGAAGNVAFFAVIAVMMMKRNPLYAVMGMNLGLIGLVANFAIVQKTGVWTLARFGNLFLFGGRFALFGGEGSWARSPPFVTLTAFCLVAAVCSIASGYYVLVALLKLVSFWVSIVGFFAAIHAIRRARVDTTEWFIAMAVAVCGMAMIALRMGQGANFHPFASLRGYYNLAFYHSQTMGPGAAFLAIYCACVFLFAGHRNRWICLPIIGYLVYCLSLTGSRTGAGTLVLGLAAAIWAAFVWQGTPTRRLRLNLSRPVIVGLFLASVVAFWVSDLVTDGRISRRLNAFIVKSAGEVEIVTIEQTIATRQGIAIESWQNFLESPLTGIGFQVSTGAFFKAHATLFTAPMEKGFLPTAILEEVGVLGTTFFLVYLIAMFAYLYGQRNIPGMAMFVAHLASNLGEASYFAVAGQGGFAWIMFVGAVLLGDRCNVPRWGMAGWPRWGMR